MSCVTFKETKTGKNIVDQILEQGQRLRNAMVQSILNNDPFTNEILHSKSSSTSSKDAFVGRELTAKEKEIFASYLRGDKMSKVEEKLALESFRNMSNTEISEFADKSSCTCSTCKTYYGKTFSSDHDAVPPLNLQNDSVDLNYTSKENTYISKESGLKTNKGDITTPSPVSHYFKYVDSLKISVHSLNLNQEGIKKVYGSTVDKKYSLPPSYTHTYFIDYTLPECLLKAELKSKAKVDSGLNTNNHVRMCSKKIYNKAIYFKQISFHDIKHLDALDLRDMQIKFQISCRTSKQKTSNVIGVAKFNMGSFESTKFLTCNQEILLTLNNDTPIVLGSVKISLQLGCGRLYFGKEFTEAISSNKENNIILPESLYDSDDKQPAQLVTPRSELTSELSLETVIAQEPKNSPKKSNAFPQKASVGGYLQCVSENSKLRTQSNVKPLNIYKPTLETYQLPVKANVQVVRDNRGVQNEPLPKDLPETLTQKGITKNSESTNLHGKQLTQEERHVLFGFIYVSEAHNLEKSCNTYFTCRPFSHDDTFYSRLVYCDANPIYNFQETVPFLYDEAFLNRLRDNYMIFEFWERCEETDSLIGISKIPLHQFYVAYRNPIIVKYILTNELPVICTDWWEPICDPINGRTYGQAQILVALGSGAQIRNLQVKRGFQNNIVKAKPVPNTLLTVSSKPAQTNTETRKSDRDDKSVSTDTPSDVKKAGNYNAKSQTSGNSTIQSRYKPPVSSNAWKSSTNISETNQEKIKKVDKSVQSDIVRMEPVDNENNSQAKDMLGSFLAQLIERQKNVCVENGTNTDALDVDNSGAADRNSNLSQTNVGDVQNSSNIRKTSDLLDSLQKALSVGQNGHPGATQTPEENKTTFKAHVIVDSALNLPSRKKCKSKKSKSRNAKPEEILPSTYVTFETTPGCDVKVTPIVPKSTNPTWNYRCDILLPVDLLTNNQKRLIFKVWRKCNGNSVLPNMQADLVLGFAALDLTVLKAGLPTVQGWFNIIDFSGKCNGQIKINITPLENVSAISEDAPGCGTHITNLFNNDFNLGEASEKYDEPSELLSRALKRKFTELDEITQRLRLRLSTVTNDESDVSNDDIADEFERDINTLCVEDDYDMINFESIPKTSSDKPNFGLLQTQESANDQNNALLQFSASHLSKQSNAMGIDCKKNFPCNVEELTIDVGDSEASAESNALAKSRPEPSTISKEIDRQLIEGKQRIASLLEKLSLITQNDADAFGNRYVSGCSVTNQEAAQSNDILKELGIDNNQSNFDPDCIINPMLFQELYAGSLQSTPLLTQRSNLSAMESQGAATASSSSTSSSVCLASSHLSRAAPDGAGNCSEETDSSVKST